MLTIAAALVALTSPEMRGPDRQRLRGRRAVVAGTLLGLAGVVLFFGIDFE